jgi:hypothetical protein
MLKLNKKIFFAGITLAVLAPVAAQTAPKDDVTQIKVAYCKQLGGTDDSLICDPGSLVNANNPNHVAQIKPILQKLQTFPAGICAYNAMADFKAKFESIKGDADYQHAMTDFNNNCVKGQKKPSVAPQPVIIANIVQDNSTGKIRVQFTGHIMGPDGKALTTLFSSTDEIEVYHAETPSKSPEDSNGVVQPACQNEADFIAALSQSDSNSDDDNLAGSNDSVISTASARISGQIEAVAQACKNPSLIPGSAATNLMNDLSDVAAPASIQDKVEGSSAGAAI